MQQDGLKGFLEVFSEVFGTSAAGTDQRYMWRQVESQVQRQEGNLRFLIGSCISQSSHKATSIRQILAEQK